MRVAPVDPVTIFRLFDFLRESNANHGLRINGVQIWSGGQDGDSYCCELATLVLDLYYKGESPIPRLQACEDVHQLAITNDWLVDLAHALPGDLVLTLNANGHAHHVAMLTERNPDAKTGWDAIAGNTSPDGRSSNGDGCHEHELLAPSSGSLVVVQYPRG